MHAKNVEFLEYVIPYIMVSFGHLLDEIINFQGAIYDSFTLLTNNRMACGTWYQRFCFLGL